MPIMEAVAAESQQILIILNIRIEMEEITITFVCKDYPKKLAAHLKEVRHFEICELEAGIYYIMGDILPIQLIIVSQLCRRDNLWLSSLTNDLNKRKTIDELVEEYQIHQNNSLYQAVMNVIVHANENKFEEEKKMCEALRELFKDEFEEYKKRGWQEGLRD